MSPRRYYRLPGGATSLKGLEFDWVHVYPGGPVHALGEGSSGYPILELIRQHYPGHLLIAKYEPGSLDRAQGGDQAIVYIDYKKRPRLANRIRHFVADIPLNLHRDFIDEACRCIASLDVPKILIWGGLWAVPYLRWAFPDRTIAFVQDTYGLDAADRGHYVYCDYLVTPTIGMTRSLFEQEFALYPTAVSIPNGVDLDQYRPASEGDKQAMREQLGLPRDKTVVLFPSALKRSEGSSYLLNWIRHCREAIPHICFAAAGVDGGDKLQGDTVSLVNLLKDSDNAFWLDRIPDEDVPRWYRAADVCLMPSLRPEEVPVAALRSLASGVPIIATGNGVFPEIVRHDYNGWLCRTEGLFREGLEALDTLSRLPELRQRLSGNARAYAESRLGKQRCLENYRAFFEGRLADIDSDLSPVEVV